MFIVEASLIMIVSSNGNLFIDTGIRYEMVMGMLLYAMQLNSTFLTFSFIIEDASEQVLQFLMPLEPIYSKNLCFYEHKCLL
jgi:hypothetical protein